MKECEEIILQDAIQTHKRWPDLPTSRHTTSFGEGILQGIMSRINDYVAKLVARETDTSTFQVFLLKTHKPLTLRSQIYHVTYLTWVQIHQS